MLLPRSKGPNWYIAGVLVGLTLLAAPTVWFCLQRSQPAAHTVPLPSVHERTQLNFFGLKNDTGPFDLASVLSGITHPMVPFVARTKTNPDFWIAIYRLPDGAWEAHADSILNYGGVWEHEETELVKTLLKECSASSLVLDVGGFVGYYAMLAALMGCKVQVWEGHPSNAFMIRATATLNSVTDYVTIHNRIATDSREPMTFSGVGMDGHVANSYQRTDNPELKEILRKEGRLQPETGYTVHPLGIDDAVPEGEVLFLKVDVEGFEPSVFRSAKRLLSQRRVKYVVLEYNMWRAMTMDEGVSMVMGFISYGYDVYELPFGNCPLRRVKGKERITQISHELRNHTHACYKWCTSLLLARSGLPSEFTSKYPPVTR